MFNNIANVNQISYQHCTNHAAVLDLVEYKMHFVLPGLVWRLAKEYPVIAQIALF